MRWTSAFIAIIKVYPHLWNNPKTDGFVNHFQLPMTMLHYLGNQGSANLSDLSNQ